MENFASLLTGTVGDYKPVPAAPALAYPVVITSYEYGKSRGNQTPYVRLICSVTDWPEDFDDEDVKSRVNIVGRKLHVDFWLTDKAIPQLLKLALNCGVSKSTPAKLIPDELIGKSGIMITKHRMSRPRHELDEPEAILEGDKLIGIPA